MYAWKIGNWVKRIFVLRYVIVFDIFQEPVTAMLSVFWCSSSNFIQMQYMYGLKYRCHIVLLPSINFYLPYLKPFFTRRWFGIPGYYITSALPILVAEYLTGKEDSWLVNWLNQPYPANTKHLYNIYTMLENVEDEWRAGRLPLYSGNPV